APAQAASAPRQALPPLDPIGFGAFGDGGSHPISPADLAANPQWIGRYEAGVEWDTVGLQECLYAAFAGASTPGAPVWNLANQAFHLDRPVRIPAGRFRINRTLVSAMTGFRIEGDGRLASVLVWGGPADQPMWLCDSAVYGVFASFGLEASSPTSQALLELDGAGKNGGLKTQQVSLRDLNFVCNSQARIGLRISKSGGAAQGDTILVDNCFFGGASLAGLAVGETSSQNALGITIHGGDFQACLPHGILVFGGQVFVQNTSFQNQAYGSSRNQIALGGADLTVRSGSGVAGFSVMRDIRSESDVLVHAEGGLYLDNASLATAGIADWYAGAAVQAGVMFRGAQGLGKPGQAGRTYVCVQAGSTGANEPNWQAAPRGRSLQLGRRGVSIDSGASLLRGALDRGGPAAGDMVVVPGAGAGGLALIAQAGGAQGGAVSLSTPAAAAINGGRAYFGRPIQDGSVRWIEVDYDAIRGAHCVNVSTGAGRTRGCAVYRDCLFARPDWLRLEDEDPWPAEVEWWRTPMVIDNVQVSAGFNKPQLPHNPFTDDPAAALTSFSLAAAPPLVRTAQPPDAARIDLAALLRTGNLVPLTVRRDLTLDAPVLPAGRELVLMATSAGGAVRRLRFGEGFRSAGPLATGAADGKVFTLRFVSDGQALIEISRSGPI
ncbi:MAG: hypothetical protein JWM33_2065, partial [Caulobacteraceae bacterium]|nr:hypothetical protein [Caulobacteraceae bacterium]